MPISSDRFEEIGDEEDSPKSGTNAAKILDFLRRNADRAFTQTEIVDETGVKPGSVGPTLVRLRERGRVDHRGTYWRVSDHEESVGAATSHGTTALEAREGDDETPRIEEWQSHAADPRECRDE